VTLTSEGFSGCMELDYRIGQHSFRRMRSIEQGKRQAWKDLLGQGMDLAELEPSEQP
jgi:hypothetical protein